MLTAAQLSTKNICKDLPRRSRVRLQVPQQWTRSYKKCEFTLEFASHKNFDLEVPYKISGVAAKIYAGIFSQDQVLVIQ